MSTSTSSSPGSPDTRPSGTIETDGKSESRGNSKMLREPSGGSLDKEIFLDHARQSRCGFPEAIFGEGKTVDQLLQIAQEQLSSGTSVFITRVSQSSVESLNGTFQGRYNEKARTYFVPAPAAEGETQSNSETPAKKQLVGYVPVLAAGTTDLPVVEEALETLNWMGIGSARIMDV